ncbi:PAS domain-containing protein [Dactylosporangium sp. CS-047395]|uniref:PAS domain-containing protein n=1 Tax=Dactylosporangium sp. CS-047395 TaxID=3239936 RepID=UPI003D8A835C
MITHDAGNAPYVVLESVDSGDQHALAERAARFRSVFTAAPAGVVLLGLDGIVAQANPAATALLGFVGDDLSGADVG